MTSAAPVAPEDIAEQLLGAAAIEEVLLVRRPLVSIARRNRYAVDPHIGHVVQEIGNALRIGGIEQRGIDVDAEPRAFAALIAATARS